MRRLPCMVLASLVAVVFAGCAKAEEGAPTPGATPNQAAAGGEKKTNMPSEAVNAPPGVQTGTP